MTLGASRTDQLVSSYIRDQMAARGLTQTDIMRAIDRKADSYVSNRITGKCSWELSELDRIAPMVGLPNALTLITVAVNYSNTVPPK